MNGLGGDRPPITAIVPTLDEADEIAETLGLARLALGPRAELLVVDGGSRDGTRRRARARARVLDAGPGRGEQLRAGAETARGEILLFLHADTWLDPGAGAAIRDAVAGGADAGCLRFVLRPAGDAFRYRILERGVNWRTRRFRTATGDQAIFATREAYERSGGVPPLALFEDVAFVRALRRVGRFTPIDARAHTSRRRWEEGGFWRTVALHWGLRGAFAAGIDPASLARIYDAVPRRDGGLTRR